MRKDFAPASPRLCVCLVNVFLSNTVCWYSGVVEGYCFQYKIEERVIVNKYKRLELKIDVS